ncbi:MAG: hypothetical protein ACJ790_04245 [Myxococcaceae bacterium]
MTLRTLSVAALLLAAAPGLAADKAAAAPAKKGKSAPSMKGELTLPKFEALPTGDGIDKPKAEKMGELKEGVGDATYDVVKVQHGKSFMRSPSGATPMGGELTEIPLTGNPPSTDKFTTNIRVHSKARNNVPIEVAIVDPRGDTVMSSEGQVVFHGSKQDDVDYQIDWDPTPLRGGGDYKVLVRLANEVKGTFPLKIVERK